MFISNWYLVDCKWAEWSEDGRCTKTCGGGAQLWQRQEQIRAEYGGKPCVGDQIKTTKCNTGSCPTTGKFAQYSLNQGFPSLF